jgi:hypothetical protein
MSNLKTISIISYLIVVTACGSGTSDPKKLTGDTNRNLRNLVCSNPLLRTSPEANATKDFQSGVRDFIAISTREGSLYQYPAIADCANPPRRFFKSEAGLNERWPVGGETEHQCRIAEFRYIARYNIQLAKHNSDNLNAKCGRAARYYENYQRDYVI